MSATQTTNQYQYELIAEGAVELDGNIILNTGAEPNDTLALALLTALNGLDWPAGVSRYFTLSKNHQVDDSYTASGDPLAFS